MKSILKKFNANIDISKSNTKKKIKREVNASLE